MHLSNSIIDTESPLFKARLLVMHLMFVICGFTLCRVTLGAQTFGTSGNHKVISQDKRLRGEVTVQLRACVCVFVFVFVCLCVCVFVSVCVCGLGG